MDWAMPLVAACLWVWVSVDNINSCGMDIFSGSPRGKEEAIKTPLNYPSAEVTERKLQDDQERERTLFQNYLRNLYAKFDYRINRCRHACFETARSYSQARLCEQECGRGVERFSGYVDGRVREMQELLGGCVANASGLPNTMDETYYCYERYNLSFTKLKQYITEESMYYE
jgi:hypothetical protein